MGEFGINKCSKCGSNDYKDIPITDSYSGVTSEIERICNNCKSVIDYWAYGYWKNEN